MRAWRATHPERNRASARRRYANSPAERERVQGNARRAHAALRAEAIEAYGGKCSWCGSTEKLELDHTFGGGSQHRFELTGHRSSTPGFLLALKRLGWPEGLQTLCQVHHRLKTRVESWERSALRELRGAV